MGWDIDTRHAGLLGMSMGRRDMGDSKILFEVSWLEDWSLQLKNLSTHGRSMVSLI